MQDFAKAVATFIVYAVLSILIGSPAWAKQTVKCYSNYCTYDGAIDAFRVYKSTVGASRLATANNNVNEPNNPIKRESVGFIFHDQTKDGPKVYENFIDTLNNLSNTPIKRVIMTVRCPAGVGGHYYDPTQNSNNITGGVAYFYPPIYSDPVEAVRGNRRGCYIHYFRLLK